MMKSKKQKTWNRTVLLPLHASSLSVSLALSFQSAFSTLLQCKWERGSIIFVFFSFVFILFPEMSFHHHVLHCNLIVCSIVYEHFLHSIHHALLLLLLLPFFILLLNFIHFWSLLLLYHFDVKPSQRSHCINKNEATRQFQFRVAVYIKRLIKNWIAVM